MEAKEQKAYDQEYKRQALKLAEEIGVPKASAELDIPRNTLYGWQRAVRRGTLDAGAGMRTPEESLNLAAENRELRKKVKEQEKELRRLAEEREILEEACAFFASSRRKSGKGSF